MNDRYLNKDLEEEERGGSKMDHRFPILKYLARNSQMWLFLNVMGVVLSIAYQNPMSLLLSKTEHTFSLMSSEQSRQMPIPSQLHHSQSMGLRSEDRIPWVV